MAVTQKEIDGLVCPVCGDEIVQTSPQYAQCRRAISEWLDCHGGLKPQASPGRLKRVKEVAELPIAKKIAKKRKADPAVYEIGGKLFGRISVRLPGKHYEGEISARAMNKNGEWFVIALVPVQTGDC